MGLQDSDLSTRLHPLIEQRGLSFQTGDRIGEHDSSIVQMFENRKSLEKFPRLVFLALAEYLASQCGYRMM